MNVETLEPLIGFDQFWAAYPKKVAKIAAQKAWKAATKAATPAQIVHAAILYAEARRGGEDRFTKNPATWLNGGCWDDVPAHAANRPRTSTEDLEALGTIRTAGDDVRRLFANIPLIGATHDGA